MRWFWAWMERRARRRESNTEIRRAMEQMTGSLRRTALSARKTGKTFAVLDEAIKEWQKMARLSTTGGTDWFGWLAEKVKPMVNSAHRCSYATGDHNWRCLQAAQDGLMKTVQFEFVCVYCGDVEHVEVSDYLVNDLLRDYDGQKVEEPKPPEVFYLDKPVLGFRQFRLTKDEHGPVLASVSNGSGRWPGPIAHAHEVPQLHVDHVGLYAMKPICAHWNLTDGGMSVCADVELWGTVIEHEHGYKAEHARIVRLYVHPGAWMPWVHPNDPNVLNRLKYTSIMPMSLSVSWGAQALAVTDIYAEARDVWYRSDADPPWTFPDDELYEQLADRYQIDDVLPLRRGAEQVLGGQRERVDHRFEQWLNKHEGEREKVRKPGEYSRHIQYVTPKDVERYGKADEHGDWKAEAYPRSGAAGAGHGPFGAPAGITGYDAGTGESWVAYYLAKLYP